MLHGLLTNTMNIYAVTIFVLSGILYAAIIALGAFVSFVLKCLAFHFGFQVHVNITS
jgi:hypothetical protein